MEGFNAFAVIAVSIAAFWIGYKLYGGFIDRLLRVEHKRKGPSFTRQDGKEFVPTRRTVIFGHHFSSIAGLGPIMGPAVAVYWGWVPAILWVVLGAIFFGAVHDYTTMMLSLRHNGRGIGEITSDYAGRRARFAFLLVIFFLLALGMGLFCITISGLFVNHHPEAVMPTALLTVLAVLIGLAVYTFKFALLPVTFVGLIFVFALSFLGAAFPVYIYQYSLPGGTDGEIWKNIRDKADHGHFEQRLVLTSWGNAAEADGLLGRYKAVDPKNLDDVAKTGISFTALTGSGDAVDSMKAERKRLNDELNKIRSPLIGKYMGKKGSDGRIMSEYDAWNRAMEENPQARDLSQRIGLIDKQLRDLENSKRDLKALPELKQRPMVVARYIGKDKANRIDMLEVIEQERHRLDQANGGKRTLQASPISHTKPTDMALYYSALGKDDYAKELKQAGGAAVENWIIALLAYALLASILPVWLLLQPRDYINSFMLYAGLLFMVVGLGVWQFSSMSSGDPSPAIVAPEFTGMHAEDLGIKDVPLVFPFLFIIIACGAISGFHSLVSSGTSSRQVMTEGDAKPVAFGGMLLEGMLAVIVIVACTVGISQSGWIATVKGESFASLNSAAPAISRFINGGGDFMAALFTDVFGVPRATCVAFLATVVVTFAMTTLDSATRLLRYNVEEFGVHIQGSFARMPGLTGPLSRLAKLLKNPAFASIAAVVSIGFFALYKEDGKSIGLYLLQLFGSTNQLLAALGLVVVTLWFRKTGRPTIYTLVPLVVMLGLSGWALGETLRVELNKEAAQQSVLLIVVSGSLLVLATWIAAEGWLAWKRPVKVTEIVPEKEAPTAGVVKM